MNIKGIILYGAIVIITLTAVYHNKFTNPNIEMSCYDTKMALKELEKQYETLLDENEILKRDYDDIVKTLKIYEEELNK